MLYCCPVFTSCYNVNHYFYHKIITTKFTSYLVYLLLQPIVLWMLGYVLNYKKFFAFITVLLSVLSNGVHSFELPFFAEQAREQGYVLPKPFGFSVNGMNVEQGINVDNIKIDPIFLTKKSRKKQISIAPQIEAIGTGIQNSDIYTFRADAWIFPFLNVYAIGGKMTGYSESLVKITNPKLLSKIMKPFNFRLDLDGTLYGGGVTIAGGMGNWFSLIDTSLTKTKLTVIDGSIDAFVFSPRVGYDFSNHGAPIKVWVGGMYQEVEQHLGGKLNKLGLPSWVNLLVGNKRFEVEQHLKTPWNTLVGLHYQVSPSFAILGEAGFGERKTAMISMEYRI